MKYYPSSVRIWLIVNLALLQACQPDVIRPETEFRVPVTTAVVQTTTMVERLHAIGELRAAKTYTLSVKASGILEIADRAGTALAEGDKVSRGQLIAAVTGEEARLAVKRDAAVQKYETAKRNMKSADILLQKNLISISQHGQVKDTLADALLDYQISLNRETQNTLLSPIDGVLLRFSRDQDGLRLASGQMVEQGQSIAQIGAVGQLIADINLVSGDIPLVKDGMAAEVSSHIWRDKVFQGALLRLSPEVDPQTRTLGAEVLVDNDDGILRPGMFVEVTLIRQRKTGVPALPVSAVTERGGQTVVFVVSGQKVEQRHVVLGIRDADQVEVVQGVAPGESIVVQGLETLSDQMAIQQTVRS